MESFTNWSNDRKDAGEEALTEETTKVDRIPTSILNGFALRFVNICQK